ncbi:MAG: NTP transferase domain-containing protein [Deltaproteobacteria bacterium]|nr:MAG: NTP transferase domain-containing protein [Deltaproteobacteria bacterium]
MNDAVALVLAAGKGTRMHSDLAKILHPICGRPMLAYVLASVQEVGFGRVLVVVGHQADRIQEVFAAAPVEWVLQPEQRGTAHAVHSALPQLGEFDGMVFICCGDTPLLTAKTLRSFLREHVRAGVDLSILSMVLEHPGSYGRIMRDSRGGVTGIIEAKDTGAQERDIREVNTGIYCASADLLRAVIPCIGNSNSQGEYYLTDVVEGALERGWKVQALPVADPEEVLGVNTREELAEAAGILAKRRSQQSKNGSQPSLEIHSS